MTAKLYGRLANDVARAEVAAVVADLFRVARAMDQMLDENLNEQDAVRNLNIVASTEVALRAAIRLRRLFLSHIIGYLTQEHGYTFTRIAEMQQVSKQLVGNWYWMGFGKTKGVRQARRRMPVLNEFDEEG